MTLLNLKSLRWTCFFNFTGIMRRDSQVREDAHLCLLSKYTVLSGKWSPTFWVKPPPQILSLMKNGYWVSTVSKVAEA